MHDAREICFLERAYMRVCGTAYDRTGMVIGYQFL
jgi:hypothetical protein